MIWLPEQNEALHADFAGFRTITLEPRRAIWEGPLTPVVRTYQVRIDYELPPHFAHDGGTLSFYPRVYVMSPMLERYKTARIPHVWWDKKYRDQPNLCLFRPSKNEWTWDNLVAETTIPDACEWLFFYESWRLTGEWRGGGEDHIQIDGKHNGRAAQIRRDALSGAAEAALAGG